MFVNLGAGDGGLLKTCLFSIFNFFNGPTILHFLNVMCCHTVC